ncbi:MAG: polysaccharide deacetylase family protein [Burkholderiales bacterium]|nr:polysaccharide deacetylase family protein [Burkholderiales bacterium]
MPRFVRATLALHGLLLLGLLVWPAQWPWLLALLVANHALITGLGLWPRSTWLGSNLRRLPAASSARGEVALTIDDGPDPALTPRVLDLLDAAGVKATFFCIGERVQRHPELAREILARGHELQSHSQRHRHNFSLLGPRGCAKELEAAQRSFEQVTGVTPRLFRAPAGLRNAFLAPVLHRLGLQLVSWTARGFDTRERDPARVLHRLTRQLRAGDILLLHDSNAALTLSGEPVVLAVLPELLRRLRTAGLHPVRLGDALALAPDAAAAKPLAAPALRRPASPGAIASKFSPPSSTA